MAAPSGVAERIAISLEAVESMLLDLPYIERDWSTMASAERASWSLDWDQVTGTHLPLLDRIHQAGLMTRDQQVRYLELHHKLIDVRPILTQLGLSHPLDGSWH